LIKFGATQYDVTANNYNWSPASGMTFSPTGLAAMTLFIRSCLLLSLAAVVSCGGGGGGDDGGGSPSPGAFTVSVDRNNVTLDFVQGANPTQQVLNATWTGTPPAQVFVGATLTGTGLNQTIPIAIGQTSATITLTAATGLLGGTYTGTVNLLVCSAVTSTAATFGSTTRARRRSRRSRSPLSRTLVRWSCRAMASSELPFPSPWSIPA
jgi:hypothetical protein